MNAIEVPEPAQAADLSHSELDSSVVIVSDGEILQSIENSDEKKSKASSEESELEEINSPELCTAVVIDESDVDNNLPKTAILLKTDWGSKVYVVGTAHFSLKSQEDVAAVIQAVQPQYVVVELCRGRMRMLEMDEEQILEENKNVTFRTIRDAIRTNGMVQGALYLLMLSLSAQLIREMGMAPGGEFRRAWQEAKNIPNCVIFLGDRPIDITLRRVIASLSWWQCIKLASSLMSGHSPIKKEDIEKYKEKDFVEKMIEEMAGEFPQVKQVFVNERDIFLAHSLLNASMMENGPDGRQPCKVVGVVGVGHLPGIERYWGKFSVHDVASILEVPPPSKASKLVKITIEASLLFITVYGIHKLALKIFRR